MKHANILPSHHMNQFARLNVSYLNEIRLKCQDVRIVECKGLWCSFPLDSPVLSGSPTISVDEEGEVGIVE